MKINAKLIERYAKGVPGELLSGGLILPLNICVGVIVACTMYTFYTLFLEGEEEEA